MSEFKKGQIGGMISHFIAQASGKIPFSYGFQTVGQIGSRYIQAQRANTSPSAEIVSISPEEATIRAVSNNVGAAYKPAPPVKRKKKGSKSTGGKKAKKAKKKSSSTGRPKEAF